MYCFIYTNDQWRANVSFGYNESNERIPIFRPFRDIPAGDELFTRYTGYICLSDLTANADKT